MGAMPPPTLMPPQAPVMMPPPPPPGCNGLVGDLLCVKAVSSNQLIFSLIVYSCGGFAFFVVFCFVWPIAKIYTTRLFYARVSIRPPKPHMDASTFCGALFRLVSWLGPVLYTDRESFIRTCGLDGYILSRIMVLMVEIYLPITLLVVGVILPVNMQGDVVDDQGQSDTAVVDQFTRFTMGNIRNGSLLFFVHFFSAYLIILWTIACTGRMWRDYAHLKIKYTAIMTSTKVSTATATPAPSTTARRTSAIEAGGESTQKAAATRAKARYKVTRIAHDDAVNIGVFNCNETEQQAGGAYFDDELMRSFVIGGRTVKARVTGSTTITTGRTRYDDYDDFDEDDYSARDTMPRGAGGGDVDDYHRRDGDHGDAGGDAHHQHQHQHQRYRYGRHPYRHQHATTTVMEAPTPLAAPAVDPSHAVAGDTASRRESHTTSRVAGAEMFNEDIIISQDGFFVDIAQYAILVQDVSFSGLQLFDDGSVSDSPTSTPRDGRADDGWVRRYIESWRSPRVTAPATTSRKPTPSVVSPLSSAMVHDIGEELTRRREKVFSRADATPTSTTRTAAKGDAKSLRHRKSSRRSFASATSFETIDASQSTTSTSSSASSGGDDVSGGGNNDDGDEEVGSYKKTKQQLEEEEKEAKARAGERALVTLLKVVRSKFETCFPECVHVVVPVMNHRKVDSLLMQLDAELEKINVLYSLAELQEQKQAMAVSKRKTKQASIKKKKKKKIRLWKTGSGNAASSAPSCCPPNCDGEDDDDAANDTEKERASLRTKETLDIESGASTPRAQHHRGSLECCWRHPRLQLSCGSCSDLCFPSAARQEEASLARIQKLKAQIKEERIRTLQGCHHVPSSFVVIFKTQMACAMAKQMLLFNDISGKTWRISAAPSPSNIIFSSLWATGWPKVLRRLFSSCCVAAFVVFPVGIFSGGIAALDSFLCGENENGQARMTNAEWWCNDLPDVAKNIITGVLPSLIIAYYGGAILPMAFYLCGLSESVAVSKGELDKRIAVWYWYWDVTNVFFGSLAGGSILSQLEVAIEDPERIPRLLGTAIPKFSNFFVNYVAYRALLSNAMRLCVPSAGHVFTYLCCCCGIQIGRCNVTERQKLKAWAPKSLRYGREVGLLILIFLISITYCIQSPIIAPFALIYYLGSVIVWRYQVLYVYVRSYESSGAMLWEYTHSRIFLSLGIMVVLLSILFLIYTMWVLGAVLLCTALPFIVVEYKMQRQKFKMLEGGVPMENIVHGKKANRHHQYSHQFDEDNPVPSSSLVVDGGLKDDTDYYEYYLPPALREGLRGWSPTCGQGWVNWGCPRYSL